jgi:ABC-2 type transport system ATP-binding protein
VGEQVPEVTAQPAIAASGLGKVYRSVPRLGELLRGRFRAAAVTALVDVSLEARPGEIVAILGENGAGKSTLLKCLAGLLAPTTGRATVCGHDVAGGGVALRRDARYVAGDPRSFTWTLSGRVNLEFFAALHGYRRAEARRVAGELLARVGLDEAAAGRRVAEYSSGMRQRLALARGFLGDPRVLLLDEPTSGLDPKAARVQRTLLRELAGAGRTLVVATHLVEEARELDARTLVLRGGRVVFEGAAGPELEAALA